MKCHNKILSFLCKISIFKKKLLDFQFYKNRNFHLEHPVSFPSRRAKVSISLAVSFFSKILSKICFHFFPRMRIKYSYSRITKEVGCESSEDALNNKKINFLLSKELSTEVNTFLRFFYLHVVLPNEDKFSFLDKRMEL